MSKIRLFPYFDTFPQENINSFCKKMLAEYFSEGSNQKKHPKHPKRKLESSPQTLGKSRSVWY